MSFIDNLKKRYFNGNIVDKLIYINIAVFVITLLISVLQGLYKGEINWLVAWFSLDDDYSSLFKKPWSIITYGFLHADFLHILMNVLVLHFIGNLFIAFFTEKQLLSFYILGTFFGGLLFIFSQNYFPLFEGKSSLLVGASAGISAIFIGIATYMPNYQLKLRFIGFVKLWYLAAFWLALDVIALDGNNAGGHFAHLGGSLFGFLYVTKANNKEINIFNGILSLFKTKRKPLKTVYKSAKKTTNSEKNTDLTQQQIDAILDKISKSGYDTLTKNEKEFLFRQGKK
ncbi:rhomboid family intramembrane serine protease [Polaribacter glomeratus]|uniref:Rhomboid family intramembrane serine protease n=1 Tax=Polaribacter glomeratus TaxID=102 RepID=A0A2S7WX21_9FLAO|nr:rhomboid family intramembrane serine protease [Polaribacter glomeratus]PQJ82150.1 rhomboid family intramembrane serine protease [Polaribacter glomeratus]TXD66745.1 rhomboid family intramembrane serine protease [Polaribacter glomeratus]